MAINPSPELDHISRRIAAEQGLDDGARRRLVDSYLDFLRSAAGSKAAVFPTVAVDEIWHRHILHTQSYAKDCERWFGTFIHHRPESVPDEAAVRAVDIADCGAEGPPDGASRRVTGQKANCSAPEPEPPCRGMTSAQ